MGQGTGYLSGSGWWHLTSEPAIDTEGAVEGRRWWGGVFLMLRLRELRVLSTDEKDGEEEGAGPSMQMLLPRAYYPSFQAWVNELFLDEGDGMLLPGLTPPSCLVSSRLLIHSPHLRLCL